MSSLSASQSLLLVRLNDLNLLRWCDMRSHCGSRILHTSFRIFFYQLGIVNTVVHLSHRSQWSDLHVLGRQTLSLDRVSLSHGCISPLSLSQNFILLRRIPSLISHESSLSLQVCLVIAAMDVAAGILGIEAQIARNKVMNATLWTFGCKEPSEDAFKLGLAAAVLLGLSHISGNLFGGCMCICPTEEFEKSSAKRQLSFACLILSWITMAVGFPTLILGTLANSKSKDSCGISRHHLLSVGGISCFVHGLFICMALCISATASIGR